MFIVTLIWTRSNHDHPFFPHSEVWQQPAWIKWREQIAKTPGYSEIESVSEDGLQYTRITMFESQAQAEDIVKKSFEKFPAQYARKEYADKFGHRFSQTPKFNRQEMKFVV